MVVLSVKFTILISWSPICIPLILLLALMRLASTSVAVLYNNLDSWHHWQTHIGVKGSNRRPFILILDSILVYETQTWMNLSPYSNLCKAKKIKQLLGYYRKFFIQFIWLIKCDIFYHLLYMVRAASRIWIYRLFFQCPISVRKNIWDQTFCVLSCLYNCSPGVKYIEQGSSQAWICISELC